MKYLILLFSVLIIGCAFARSSSYAVTGTNLKTPYGTGDAQIIVTANTEVSIFK